MTDVSLKKILVRRRLVRILCSIGIITLVAWGVSPWVTLGFNLSSSVDGTCFLILKKDQPERGDLIAFWPPDNRFYRNIWFVKYVAGMEGDKVDWQQRDFFLNGQLMGKAKELSQSGLPLIRSGSGIIPDNQYFVWTSHPDSFDSRYKDIGWITQKNVIGRAIRLF